MKKIILLSYFFFFLDSYAQSVEGKPMEYYEIWDSYYETKDTIKQINLAKQYIKKAKTEKNDLEIGRGYVLLSQNYFVNNPVLAIKYLDFSIHKSKNINNNDLWMFAYIQKSRLYSNLGNYNKAIESLKSGEKLAQKRDEGYMYYMIKLHIGIIKSEELGEFEESLSIYRECLKGFEKIKDKDDNINAYYLNNIFCIADVYKSNKNIDSCRYYNNFGLIESKKYKNLQFENLFYLNEGANLINEKRYKEAEKLILSIQKSLYENDYDSLNPLASNYYLAKAYEGQGNEKKTVDYYVKVDSFYVKKNKIIPEFLDGYSYLVNYYSKIGNKEKQLHYLTKFNKIESDLRKKYSSYYKTIKEKYEIPEMMNEKNNTINFFKTTSFIVSLLFCIVLLVAIRAIYVNRRNKKLFEKIIYESSNWNKFPLLLESGEIIDIEHENISDEENKEIIKEKDEIKSIDINPEIINQIKSKLKIFEKNKGFLKKSITAQTLADEFDTNSKYITKVINEYKSMKVNDYINNLRVEYAVMILQKDVKLRKYNIDALADEFGFKSIDTFNKYFVKRTGIKPSYFIKNITFK